MRDMTAKQFQEAIDRRDIKRAACGYYNVTEAWSVYARNAGSTRRAQLAYLIRKQKKAITEDL